MDSSPIPWPLEDEEEDEEGGEAITKKLVFDCVETPLKPEVRRASKKQSVVVYLRVRPKHQREILSMDASCLHLVSQKELQAVAPVTSQTFKNKTGVRCPAESSQLFSFTHIFNETATQREVFEEAMMPTLKDFFGGQNCLVFTYGVTNSGKTYTVTGTPTEPGILPRSLDLIFNSISPQQLSSLQLKPKNFSGAVYLTEDEMTKELARKDNLLTKAREISISELQGVEETTVEITTNTTSDILSNLSKTTSNYSKASESGTSLCEIQVEDGSIIDLGDSVDVSYSLWVSFAEIYNEFIYDLFGEELINSNKKHCRSALKLAEDRNHNHFIKGLVEVKVSSMEEALLLLQMGLRQRHVASTRLNYESSRSHTIFTVKMIKMNSLSERPHSAFVNRISIVDLAGAERSKETGARGMRVREAGNINNSLLTLGKCIEAMRYNQNKRKGDEHIVPFRDSKLTRLFQNYFVGKGKGVIRQGKITMLVNVSNNASVFDETSHVLKFSAITSKIIPIVKPTPIRRVTRQHPHGVRKYHPATKPATNHCNPVVTPLPLREGGLASVDPDKTVEAKKTVSVTFCERCEAASEECMELRQKIHSLEIEKMECEYQIRQEVCREFQEQITDIEETHREELEEQAEEMQVMYKKRMHLLQKSMKKQYSRKRCRREEDDDDDEDVIERETDEEEGLVTHLKEKVARLEEQVQTERDKNIAISAELKDMMESHESIVTRLNQQMNCVSLKLSEAETQGRHLEEEMIRVKSLHAAELEAAEEKEKKLISTCNDLQKRVDEVEAEMKEVTVARDDLKEDRLSLISEYEASEQKLREEIAELKSELAIKSDEVTNLSARVECSQREMEVAGREQEEKMREALAGREDAMAEVEILQSRISELTREAKETESRLASANESSCETELLSLREKVLELESQLAGKDLAMASLLSLREKVLELESQLAGKDLAMASLQTTTAANSEKNEGEISCLKKKIIECEDQLTEKEQAMAVLKTTTTASTTAVEAELSQLNQIKIELESQVAKKDEIITSLESSSVANSEMAQRELCGLHRKCLELETQLSERDGMIESLQASSVANSEMAQRELCGLHRKCLELETQLSERDGMIESLQASSVANSEMAQRELCGLHRKCLELETQLSERDGMIESLQASSVANSEMAQRELCGLHRKCLELETQLSERDGMIESLQASSVANSEMAQRELCGLHKKCLELETQLSERDGMIESLQASSVANSEMAQRELCGLHRKCLELETQLSERDGMIESLQATIDVSSETAQSKLSTLREKIVEIESKLSEKGEEISSLRAVNVANLESTQCEVSNLLEKNVQLETQLSGKVATIQAMNDTMLEAVRDQQKRDDIIKKTIEKFVELETKNKAATVASEEQKTAIKTLLAEKETSLQAAFVSRDSLAKKIALLEAQLVGSEEERLRLSAQVEKLTLQVKEHQLSLAQRECEILASTKQYEQQLADMRVTSSTMKSESSQDEEEEGRLIDDQLTEKDSDAADQPEKRSLLSVSVDIPRSDSKPFVAVLERSSQLIEDTFSEETPRLIIDATPPAARRGRRGKKLLTLKKEKEEPPLSDDIEPSKKGKYSLRNRKKHKRFEEDVENKSPAIKKYIVPIKKTKVLVSSQPSPPPPPPVRVTRLKVKALRKSQISGPIGLMENIHQPPVPHNSNSLLIGPCAPPLYFDHPTN